MGTRAVLLVVAAFAGGCAGGNGGDLPAASAPERATEPAHAPADDPPPDAFTPPTTDAPTAAATPKDAPVMDMIILDRVLREVSADVEGGGGRWKLTHLGAPVICVADPAADRMRLFVPVAHEEEMTEEQRARVLEANFHTALDARYAVSDGILFSAFLHPLSSLTEENLRDAVDQVATLARTFGTSYASSNLVFAPPR